MIRTLTTWAVQAIALRNAHLWSPIIGVSDHRGVRVVAHGGTAGRRAAALMHLAPSTFVDAALTATRDRQS